MKLKMTSIHECLGDAGLNLDIKYPMEEVHARVDPKILEAARSLCFNHGTTISAFLRECLTSLVNDYQDTKTVE